MKKWQLISVCILWSHLSMDAKDYNIISFGAKPDGITMSTVAIQKAIDKAHADGGGIVIFPAGKFLSGSIVLKNGIELRFMKNSWLIGSTDISDYIKLN